MQDQTARWEWISAMVPMLPSTLKTMIQAMSMIVASVQTPFKYGLLIAVSW
jgi:hypothetical protein